MGKKIFRTVAFQIDDWDFLKEYDKRQQESGLSVKNYFVSLVKADIAMHQAQDASPAQENGDAAPVQSAEIAEQPERQPGYEEWSEPATPENTPDNVGEPSDDVDAYLPKQDEEMMNLFVKIPKAQREALETLKNETGETAGAILNRLIDDFLDNTDSLPEGFEEAYQRHSADIKSCDTNWSAKIPTRVNQELTDYLNSFGGSRNALMASLVELELKDQEMTQDEDQGMTGLT